MIEKNIKVDVGFVLTGRDDNYAEDFIDRFTVALAKNLEILDRHNLTYRIVVVDFNPFEGALLIDNPKLSSLLKDDKILNVIVDRSVVIDDGLCETGFYEYFGKNVGARFAFSKYLFMTNADIIISNEIVDFLKEVSKHDDHDHFYRLRYRQEIQNGKMLGQPRDLYVADDVDSSPICGIYSGDATVFLSDVFTDVATGYNETDDIHRTNKGQASMDSEILWNLHLKGVGKKLVDLVYYHVTHQRQPKDTEGLTKGTYTNRENWGYLDYPIRVVNDNTIEIYK